MSFFYPIDSALHRPDGRSGRDDRLVRRFLTGGRLHIHLRLGGADASRSRPIAAEVINLSITGALVRFPAKLRMKPGATVTLGNPPSTVVCRVVHTAMITADQQDLGVEFVEPTDAFCADVSRAVGALRRDRGHVLAAWHRPN
ncbi:MAG: PilZ domain-containing protein [Acidimicrobiales bacterium]|nr:PilZ domain-containing protein [Acidimicrobiales bacterium]